MTNDEGQPRLFDPGRYSPATVAVFVRLPESSARAFAIASALGSVLDQNGTTKPLTSVRQATGTLITPRRRPAILAALGDIDRRQWSRYVTAWAHEYLAHRCSRGTVFLFAKPLLNPCPACSADIPVDHNEKPARPNRGLGFAAMGRSTAQAWDVQQPILSAPTAQASPHERPFRSTTATSQKNGLARDELGVGLKESEGRAYLGALPGLSEIPRQCERCGHEHFSSGGCRRTVCDCEEATKDV